MGKIVIGLILGFVIGVGCRRFDIPLPGPPKMIGALVILAVTLGYVGADYLLAHHAKVSGGAAHPAPAKNGGGPVGLPPPRERAVDGSNRVKS